MTRRRASSLTLPRQGVTSRASFIRSRDSTGTPGALTHELVGDGMLSGPGDTCKCE